MMMMKVNRWVVIVVTLLGVLLAAGSVLVGMGESPKPPNISIHEQKAHLSPVMLGVGSVFMKIINAGKGDDTLLSARASDPNIVVELHDVREGKMVEAENIAVPSLSIVELKPGSLHMMLFKLPQDIKKGHELVLYLRFKESGEKPVKVKFMPASGKPMSHSMH